MVAILDHDDIVKAVEEHIYKNPIHFKPSAHCSYSEQGRLFHFTVGGGTIYKREQFLKGTPKVTPKALLHCELLATTIILY